MSAGFGVRTLIDGVETDLLSVNDRGLQYGDGLFETIAIREGSPCLWHAHYERLAHGADRLGIPCPPQDLLMRDCQRLTAGVSAGVAKLILTRGGGGRGYRPPQSARPSRILSLHPQPDYPSAWRGQGVAVIFCRTPLGGNPVLAGLKHLNRLEQVMARAEWRDPRIAEGLMSDGRGRVIGGTMSNLFLVSGGRILTPRLDTCGIAGTVRALVLKIAAGFGIEVKETDLGCDDVASADGLFLTNSLIGVWPVRWLGAEAMSQERLPAALLAEVCNAVRTRTGG
jgi:4-amino-4-deoxychorismate lyase